VDSGTYDVIDNQSPEYEVIKKGKANTPPTNTREGMEFALTSCAAYPVSGTLVSQEEEMGDQPAEYEVAEYYI
jgi:hypothetical protein